MDLGFVHFPGIDQDNIARGKLVGAPLNTVGHVTAEKNQDLVKIVIVVVKLPAGSIF